MHKREKQCEILTAVVLIYFKNVLLKERNKFFPLEIYFQFVIIIYIFRQFLSSGEYNFLKNVFRENTFSDNIVF